MSVHFIFYCRSDPYSETFRFDVNEKDFFTQDVRIAVVSFILERTAFTDEPESADSCVGVQKLLDDKIYKGAFPLHDVSDLYINRFSPLYHLFFTSTGRS